jgi:tryptophan synthase beta chain
VLNHVLMHQTIIGQEAKVQMEMAGYYPDVVIACVGGGSNFGGMTLPFAGDKLTGRGNARIVAAEPAA